MMCLLCVLFCVQTKLYNEDWIGLKTLDDAGKVKYISVPGNHIEISINDMKEHVIPYLVDQSSTRKVHNDLKTQGATQLCESVYDEALVDVSSSFNRPPQVESFMEEMVGFNEG